MPRHKISIDEALKVIKRDRPSLLRQEVVDAPEPVVAARDKPVIKRIGTTTVVISLHAQHTLGCGGSLHVDETGQKAMGGNTYNTYGPGVVTVPSRIAGQLLHQDMLAKQADARLFDQKQRSYLVVERRGQDGLAATIGMQVSDDFFGNSFGLNSNFQSVII